MAMIRPGNRRRIRVPATSWSVKSIFGAKNGLKIDEKQTAPQVIVAPFVMKPGRRDGSRRYFPPFLPWESIARTTAAAATRSRIDVLLVTLGFAFNNSNT